MRIIPGIFLLLFLQTVLSCAAPVGERLEAGSLTIENNISTDTFHVGDYRICLDIPSRQIKVVHAFDTNHLLWSTIPGQAFLLAASSEGYFEDKRGTFILHDKISAKPYIHQYIQSINSTDNELIITGYLKQKSTQSQTVELQFNMRWQLSKEGHLQWHVVVDSSRVNRLYCHFQTSPDEVITGMGEQPTHFDHKGNRVPVLVQEQGIGRGDIRSLPVKVVLGASTGNDYTTYKAVPFYLTSRGQSLFLENTAYSEFDFTQPEQIQIKVFDHFMTGRILPAKTPADIIESYTAYAGRMRPLPDWVHAGAIIGMQGGTNKVYDVWKTLANAGTPITAFWLQDWVGQRKTILGKQLWWNWELDNEQYPHWKKLTDSLHQASISVMGYINPFLVDVDGYKPNWKRNLYQEALDSGFLVMNDKNEPYLNVTSFKAALLDLSHPGCRVWVKRLIQTELIDNGFRGWMADFGEALPFDVRLNNVRTTAAYHNQYVEDWAQLNREAIEEMDRGEDITFFSRSAFTRSPTYTTLFWQGDQMVNWGKNDGLPSALTGLLSGGLSGFSLNHSDIGGYASIDFPLAEKIIRSEELLIRWMQMSAFTVVFRTHEGLGPEKNHQVYSDNSTARHFAYWAKVHQAWKFYRDTLLQEASGKGWPIVRPMAFVFPNDKEAWLCKTQMMVGDALLIVPVLTPDTDSIRVYLPEGEWVNAWTDEAIISNGQYFEWAGYADKPGVFYRKNNETGIRFAKALAAIRL